MKHKLFMLAWLAMLAFCSLVIGVLETNRKRSWKDCVDCNFHSVFDSLPRVGRPRVPEKK
jgi:hypothetical protein